MNPTLSVIVPIYNVERYLHKCIQSIINQSYEHLEIILVDDGSPDNCGIICDQFAKKDKRIKVIHQKNKGLSAARNSGLDIATGDYIGFIDSDDWVDEKLYETLLKLAQVHQCDLISCVIQESNKLDNNISQEQHKPIILDNKELFYNYLKFGFYIMRNLYSKELIQDLRFDENISFVEDMFFGTNVITKVKKSVFINNPLYIYNVDNNTSLTRLSYNKNNFLTLKANIYMQEKMTALFPSDTELKTKLKKRIIGNCLYHLQNLHLPSNSHIDPDNAMKKKSKQIYNSNFVFFKNPSLFKTIVRLLNSTHLTYFYRFYFALKKRNFNLV